MGETGCRGMTFAQTIPKGFASEKVLFAETKQLHPFLPHVLFVSSRDVSRSVTVIISLDHGAM
jgi:hypothetical protein